MLARHEAAPGRKKKRACTGAHLPPGEGSRRGETVAVGLGPIHQRGRSQMRLRLKHSARGARLAVPLLLALLALLACLLAIAHFWPRPRQKIGHHSARGARLAVPLLLACLLALLASAHFWPRPRQKIGHQRGLGLSSAPRGRGGKVGQRRGLGLSLSPLRCSTVEDPVFTGGWVPKRHHCDSAV
jgi:hypothetical protein